jgi:hypothetical protein
MFLTLTAGCEKMFIGGEKIVGTATINGEKYKESTIWGWNFRGYPSSIRLLENYKMFHFVVRLSPEESNNFSHTINFYVYEDDAQFKINHPYEIEIYDDLDVESLFWGDVIPYFSNDMNKDLIGNADGIAHATSSSIETFVPLKGKFVLENIDFQTKVCHGHYSLTSSENESEKLVIDGKFETRASIINYTY